MVETGRGENRSVVVSVTSLAVLRIFLILMGPDSLAVRVKFVLDTAAQHNCTFIGHWIEPWGERREGTILCQETTSIIM